MELILIRHILRWINPVTLMFSAYMSPYSIKKEKYIGISRLYHYDSNRENTPKDHRKCHIIKLNSNVSSNSTVRLYTCNAIFRQASRTFGRTRIKLQTVPSPWVTRSPSYPYFPWWSEPGVWQRSSNNFKAESGRNGASPKNLLKDLSEAGKHSRKHFAYKNGRSQSPIE